MPRTGLILIDISQAYATRAEFCEAFGENMNSMHLLSFLLTADLAKAEECFVSGLEDCVETTCVFRDWARSWARRTIIQNAIRMLAPRRNQSASADAPSDPVSCSFGRTLEAGYAIRSICRLEDFERFVIVISVLEKYTDHDCSVLLGCAQRDITETRMRALQHLAEFGRDCLLIRDDCDSKDHEEAAAHETQMESQF